MISKQLILVLFFFILVIVAQAGNELDTDLNNNIQKSGIVSTVNHPRRCNPADGIDQRQAQDALSAVAVVTGIIK
ncbi:unnamed protein product [Rotaria sordida]|uniref:Uncharacterized protein n=1 Tax=Rotaria sordida TaxID=392033 RepID=A0A813YXZ5_9BILA|nr:unnamed protein product [Rotaria sordida]